MTIAEIRCMRAELDIQLLRGCTFWHSAAIEQAGDASSLVGTDGETLAPGPIHWGTPWSILYEILLRSGLKADINAGREIAFARAAEVEARLGHR